MGCILTFHWVKDGHTWHGTFFLAPTEAPGQPPVGQQGLHCQGGAPVITKRWKEISNKENNNIYIYKINGKNHGINKPTLTYFNQHQDTLTNIIVTTNHHQPTMVLLIP